MISVPQALDMAWKHYQAGQLQEAEQLYLQILQVDPEPGRCLAPSRGDRRSDGPRRSGDRLPQCGPASQAGISPRRTTTWATCSSNQGKLPEAVASYQQAVRVKPDYAVAHNNLGNALREQGRLAEAVASLEQALRLRPDYAEAHNNLGIALQGQGMLAEAVAELSAGLPRPQAGLCRCPHESRQRPQGSRPAR